MKILALNAGSNTLTYKLVDVSDSEGSPRIVRQGMFDRTKGKAVIEAAEEVIAKCSSDGDIEAVGVRIVHGGTRFQETTRITSDVLEDLRPLVPLAPLHLPTDIALAEAVIRRLPNVPVLGVFDTAFHRNLTSEAFRYALPVTLNPIIRRFGFHGIAHQHVTKKLAMLLGTRPNRVMSLHLGGGASICAVRNGVSIDTSMGMTPLEGLVMSTRSGDLDPGIVLHLLREGKTIDEVDHILNQESGMLGLSGQSGDIRVLEPAAQRGDAKAELALSIFAYRARKYIGAYIAALEGVDAIVLSGALAEHSPTFRKRVLSNLECFDIELNQEENLKAGPETPALISAPSSGVAVWLIPVDEESEISLEVHRHVNSSARQ